MKLQNIVPLYVALTQQLDGYSKVVDGKEVRCYFQLGAARLDLARNALRLKGIMDAFDKARNDLLRELTDGGNSLSKEENPEAFDKYSKAVNEMQEKDETVEFVKIKRAALKIDTNDLPVSALMMLEEAGILED